MDRIVIERTVSDDGVLQITLPLSVDEAGRDVRVTIEPIDPRKPTTQDEWRAAILATAGGWEGDFERPPVLELEERDPLS